MQQYVWLLLLLTSGAYAQEAETNNARSSGFSAESLLADVIAPTLEEVEVLTFAIDDIDDITAHVAIADNVDLFVVTENMFEIGMAVDRYDEDQLTDLSPTPINDIYPVDRSSRSILAGIQLTF